MKFISNHIASCIRCPINHRLSSEGGEAGLDEAVGDRGGVGVPCRCSDRHVQQLQVRPHVQTWCTGRPTGHSALARDEMCTHGRVAGPDLDWWHHHIDIVLCVVLPGAGAGSETMQGSSAGPLTVYRIRCSASPASDWLVWTWMYQPHGV